MCRHGLSTWSEKERLSTLPAANSIVHYKTCKDKWKHFDLCICIICQGIVFKWRHLTTPLVLIPMFSALFFLYFLDFSHDLCLLCPQWWRRWWWWWWLRPRATASKNRPFLICRGRAARPGLDHSVVSVLFIQSHTFMETDLHNQ